MYYFQLNGLVFTTSDGGDAVWGTSAVGPRPPLHYLFETGILFCCKKSRNRLIDFSTKYVTWSSDDDRPYVYRL
ncbi:MAG: hypothetical protein M3342_16550 [Bacteroidota bacterium]|nr:hypothetical protein [Bacteroidota bacterium]